MTSLILGENGCGKTSVLEAIFIALRGKSFKATDKDILNRDSDYYRIELIYKNNEKIVITYDENKKQFLVEDKKYNRLPKKYRYPVVLFEPSDLNLIHTSPTKKRDYFDSLFSNLNDKYYSSLLKYNKALKQRNMALKSDFLKRDELFSWNVILAKYGCEIYRERRKNINEINKDFNKTYYSIAENEDKIKINYLSEIIDENSYIKILEENFEKDKIVQHTTFGIHKDNYNFIFNNVDADGSASRGEIRSIILALKFIEAKILEKDTGRMPLVLLDDVFSELDDKRQRCLVKNFKNNQVILTSVKGVKI